jgi:hypothetical protein
MPKSPVDQNEAAHLYMKIMNNAKAREDGNLMDMIRGRLARHTRPAYFTESGCEVKPFPVPFMMTQESEEETAFWKEQEFWTDLLQCVAFISLLLSWVIYFFVLVANSSFAK